MSVTVVVGAQWGDEGKAKVIDLLARENDVVARYQGGHNAGHTVVVGSEKYALQLIPSGVLYEHVTPVIGNGVVVDLPTLFAEIDRLEARGVSCSRLKVSSQAHLIFPWHQTLDALSEGSLGDNKIGTTLKGIGPAYADKANRTGVRVGQSLDSKVFAALVRSAGEAANVRIVSLGGEALDVAEIVARYVTLAERLRPYVADTIGFLHDAVDSGRRVLLEGPRGRCSTSITAPTPTSRRPIPPRAGPAWAAGSVRVCSIASSESPRPTPPGSVRVRSPPS